MYIIIALCFVCTGLCFLLFSAPYMTISNPCRRFILIYPLHYVDHWGELIKPDEHVPWYVYVIIYCAVLSGMMWPLWGFIELTALAMCMAYPLIQKITETGPYENKPE